MKLAICDDSAEVCRSLCSMIESSPSGADAEITVFSSAGELTEAAQTRCFDLVFVDIMLGEDDGIAAARQVTEVCPNTRIVFVTAHVLEYAEEIFAGLRPYGYIGKPLHSTRVNYYLARLAEEMKQRDRRLDISVRGVKYGLHFSEIRYLESDRRQVRIYCADSKCAVYETLNSISGRLDDGFVRCHQSYIVNLAYVERMENDTIYLKKNADESEGVRIRVSRNRLKETRERYFKYKGRAVL